MQAPTLPRAVSEAEAAEILGLRPRTLQDWRFRGVGPRWLSYSSKAVRYRLADLEAFMEAAERTSTSDTGKAA